MSAYGEDLLRARFEALAPEPMQPDWLDVRRRAQNRRRRTLVLAALAATLVVVLVGCTAVFGPRIVSFADADPSPPETVEWVSLVRRANAITAPELPDFDPTQTRRLLDGPFRRGTLAIDLTPAEGGFCVSLQHAGPWGDGSSTDCVGAERRRSEPIVLVEVEGRPGAPDSTVAPEQRQLGVTSLVGWTTAPGAARAELRFEDGTVSGVARFLRVTEPIDAALFVVEVPSERTHHPRRAVELVVLDAAGNRLAGEAIAYADADEWTFPRFGDANAGFPPAADGARAELMRFPGTAATVVVAPGKDGVTCLSFRDRPGPSHGGQRVCLRRPEDRALITLDRDAFWPGPGAGPKHPVILYGLVEPSVRRVELRFQGGTRTLVQPKRSFVVYEIPPRQHAPGTRLVWARLLDAEGRVVRRIVFDPSTRDLYPCDDPVDPGLGPPVCP